MRKWFMVLALSYVLQHAQPVVFAVPPSNPTVTSVRDILSLSPNEAAKHLPVQFHARVTYASRVGAMLFVQDGTNGILVGLEQRMPSLRYGQVVEVRGRTGPGLFPSVRGATLSVLSDVRPAQARPSTAAAATRGEDDCDLISLRGVVRGVGKQNGETTLKVSLGEGRWAEAVFADGAALTDLWDATVQLRGVATFRPWRTGGWDALTLYCWDRSAVTVEKPGTYDPFIGRKLTVSEALQETNSERRICIDGRFIGMAGDAIVLEGQGTNRISVLAARPPMLRSNDRVQASGFLVASGGKVALEEPQLRILAPRFSTNDSQSVVESPVFTRIEDIRRDRGAQSIPGAPVRIRAVVTFYDGGWMFFVQDDTAGIFVALRDRKLGFRPGQLVEIEGFTDPGDYAPVIVRPHIKLLAEASLPAARVVRHDELLRGVEDSQRVEISGVVRSVSKDPNGAILDLAVPGGRIRTFVVLGREALPVHLVDAAVRVRGVCGSYFNDRRQFTGVQLYVAELDDIEIDDPAPSNAFANVPQPISDLMQFGSVASRRVTIGGTVTYAAPNRGMIVVQDASGGVTVRGTIPPDLLPGERVVAAGFPTTGGYTPGLSEAIIRRIGAGSVVFPRAIRSKDAMSGSFDGELVTIEGRLLEQFNRDENTVLVIESAGSVFEARVPEKAWRGAGRRIERQSTLRLTGVCSIQINQSLTPRGFKILLRTPSDVTVLGTLPWWTDPHHQFLIGAGVLIGVCSLIGFWGLRRKIRQQTAVIREQLKREQKANDQLEAKVQERTAELMQANASLEEARADLEDRVARRTNELSSLNLTLTEEIAVRRRSEETVRLGEERFRFLAQATHDVIWDWDVRKDHLWWSDAFESAFGHQRSGLEPGIASWTRRVHPDDLERVEATLCRVVATEAVSWNDEYRFAHADGTYRYVMDRCYLIRDEAGGLVRMVGAMTDLTVRNAAEESLRLSEERFSKAFRGSPVPMAISTVAEGRYIDVNDAFLHMLGFRREEVVGQCSMDLGIWKNPDARASMVQALRENKLIRDLQVEFRARNGETKHVLGSAETIQLKGEPCIIALFNDLTTRIHLEAQLRQAQKMEAVGQLAAGIAHDFNNILTVVQGHVGLLLAGVARENSDDSLLEIRNAADRAGNLTRQLLTFSRRQPVQPQSLDLNQIIAGMSTMLRRLLGEQVILQYDQAPGLPRVRADQGMLEQVIMNLSVNARDAMPEGGTLTFKTDHCAIDQDYVSRNPKARVGSFVRMTVADTGCGMSPQTLERAFEPFFTTKEVGQGTGLGLATVYGILQQHQGWIETRSEVDRGTTFEIYLPEQTLPAAPALPRISEPPAEGGTETILLVEDEPGVRRLAESVLSRQGYHVLSAADGLEALEIWEKNRERIDLLLTDMVMPQGVSGLQLAGRLRAEAPQLKVIYTSGYSTELIGGESALQEGMTFLPKPYPASQLATAVRECLDQKAILPR